MDQSTVETMFWARSKAEEALSREMEVCTRVTSLTTIFMEEEYTPGLMERLMRENGRLIKCGALDYTNGLTREYMKDNTMTIRGKVRADLSGQMAVYMWEVG